MLSMHVLPLPCQGVTDWSLPSLNGSMAGAQMATCTNGLDGLHGLNREFIWPHACMATCLHDLARGSYGLDCNMHA